MTHQLALTDLAGVYGGMNLDGVEPSKNVEDRRDISFEDSMKIQWPQPEPIPPLVRTPGDLPSQIGLDDIGKNLGIEDAGGGTGF